MREFDLVIEHRAGKENLFADALSRKYKYSLNPTEEQDFISQSMDPTEDSTEPQDISITTNNLSIYSIPTEIFDGYEFDLHPQVVEYNQLNDCHQISAPANDTSSITNDNNIPAIITDIVNDAWEQYEQHRKQHNTDYHDYYCRSHGSLHQKGNRYFPLTRCSVCGNYGHGCLDGTLVEAVYQKEKEFESYQ